MKRPLQILAIFALSALFALPVLTSCKKDKDNDEPKSAVVDEPPAANFSTPGTWQATRINVFKEKDHAIDLSKPNSIKGGVDGILNSPYLAIAQLFSDDLTTWSAKFENLAKGLAGMKFVMGEDKTLTIEGILGAKSAKGKWSETPEKVTISEVEIEVKADAIETQKALIEKMKALLFSKDLPLIKSASILRIRMKTSTIAAAQLQLLGQKKEDEDAAITKSRTLWTSIQAATLLGNDADWSIDFAKTTK